MPSLVNVVCYSYKGGSGRSTAAVNIAFALARQGKKVACVDLDIGAPGLHMIMKSWDKNCAELVDRNDGVVGVQDFLNRDEPREQDIDCLEAALFDVGEYQGPAIAKTLRGGQLIFVFSSTRQRTLTDLTGRRVDVERFLEKYRILQEALARRLGATSARDEVYIVVDAPNGITPVSLPLLRCADLVLMFYRHSLQHVLGTIETAEKIRHYLAAEIERRFVRILLVGSCVPEHLIDSLSQHRAALPEWKIAEDALYNKFMQISGKLNDFANAHFTVRQLEGRIIEDEVLKILEQPLTDDGIHRIILDPNADPNEMSSTRTIAKIAEIASEVIQYGDEVKLKKAAV